MTELGSWFSTSSCPTSFLSSLALGVILPTKHVSLPPLRHPNRSPATSWLGAGAVLLVAQLINPSVYKFS